MAKHEEIRQSNPLRNDVAVRRLEEQRQATEEFRVYAKDVVSKYGAEGKDIRPMHVAMRQVHLTYGDSYFWHAI